MNQTPRHPPQVRIRQLTEDDLPSAVLLSRSAGWNQLEADWRRLVEYQPHGCFAAMLDGELAGTVTTTCYGSDLAWVGMMLVNPRFRRQGIATALLEQSLAHLQAEDVVCIKLDATAAGRPLYERLGFRSEFSYRRWQRDDSTTGPDEPLDPLGDPWSADDDNELDVEAFGADRSAWLKRLSESSVNHRHARGFGMLRPGHIATTLGPLVARDADAAKQIAQALLRQAPGSVFWDIPQPYTRAVQLAETLGFRPVRELTRMWTGKRRLVPAFELQYGCADPATG